MDKRATEADLDALHLLVAEQFTSEIRAYKNGDMRDNEGNRIAIPASLLAQAAKFLKDNGVDRAIRAGDPLDILNDELPTKEDERYG